MPEKKHLFTHKKKPQPVKKHEAEVAKEERKEVSKPKHRTFSPKIPRFITERQIVLGVLLLFLLGAIGVIVTQAISSWHNLQYTKQSKVKLEADLQTWDGITKRYPTYRDAYFEAAVLAYRLGDSQKEALYLQKLEAIDPNFPLSGDLEKYK